MFVSLDVIVQIVTVHYCLKLSQNNNKIAFIFKSLFQDAYLCGRVMTLSGVGKTPRISEGIMSALFVSMEAGIGLSSLKTFTSSTAFTMSSNNKAMVSDTSVRFHGRCDESSVEGLRS